MKKKVKFLEKQVKQGKMICIEAHKYLSGHLGYINVANTKKLRKQAICYKCINIYIIDDFNEKYKIQYKEQLVN